jgi:hypothetical protein
MSSRRGRSNPTPVPVVAASLVVAAVCVLPLLVVAVKAFDIGWGPAWDLLWRSRVGELLRNTAALVALTVSLPARAGEAGKLFGSVTAADVAAAIAKAGGPKLDKRSISIDHAIKSVGTHGVTVKVHGDVQVKLSVEVTAA